MATSIAVGVDVGSEEIVQCPCRSRVAAADHARHDDAVGDSWAVGLVEDLPGSQRFPRTGTETVGRAQVSAYCLRRKGFRMDMPIADIAALNEAGKAETWRR
ncbi:hypothetical protein IU429_15160 [Nocardia elegans]|uniref:Transposase n=1 Tax=Nocardia elegans TaxID=300029 RepID=A0ABW6T8P1_9NOCA|nr:hypothetical protein [Nocardia elegans]MBF6449009.1 hypothetical protein [Nocardia elegans]